MPCPTQGHATQGHATQGHATQGHATQDHHAAQAKAAGLGERMQAQAEQAAELMKALSHPQRLRVMCLLIDGERTVGEINAEIELSQSALSQHLALLREGGLVSTRREAQNVYYSVAPGPVQRVIQTLHDAYCPTESEDEKAGS